jgi:hypothetical protein
MGQLNGNSTTSTATHSGLAPRRRASASIQTPPATITRKKSVKPGLASRKHPLGRLEVKATSAPRPARVVGVDRPPARVLDSVRLGVTRVASYSQQLVQTALVETLDSVVSPAVRTSVLSAALAEAEGGELPDDAIGLRRFIQGPLREALVRVLGPTLAETVTVELEIVRGSIPPSVWPRSARISGLEPGRGPNPSSPAASRTPSAPPSWRSRSPSAAHRSSAPVPRRSFSPASVVGSPRGLRRPSPARFIPGPKVGAVGATSIPGPEPTPLLVAVTGDADLVQALEERARDRFALRVVADVLDLAVAASLARRVAVLVDCRRPSVRPVAVAALADELPSTATVLLWRPSVDDERAVQTVAPESALWPRLPPLSVEELIEECVALVT